jgi:hypothetical protein
MFRRTYVILLVVVIGALLTQSVCSGEKAGRVRDRVVPIDWNRFKSYDRISPKSRDLEDCRKVLLNNAYHNLNWATKAAENMENGVGVSGRAAHDVVRPACSAAYGLAVVLNTGVFDERQVGCPRDVALRRTTRLIEAAGNCHQRKSWGYPWQSAL